MFTLRIKIRSCALNATRLYAHATKNTRIFARGSIAVDNRFGEYLKLLKNITLHMVRHNHTFLLCHREPIIANSVSEISEYSN